MHKRLSKNRSFVVLLAAATTAHLFLLLIPAAKQQAPEPDRLPAVTVRLAHPEPAEPKPVPAEPEPAPAEPLPTEPPRMEPVEPVELAELPAAEPEPPEVTPEESPSITAHRILSDLREEQKTDPLAAPSWDSAPSQPDYFVRHQPVLDEVINEPSLQLPFEDTRIYLVDSYDPGFGGSVQRFFDEVTVPFGFTTKNKTRIQCAWILVIAGCSWGDASLYYAGQRAKKRNPNL